MAHYYEQRSIRPYCSITAWSVGRGQADAGYTVNQLAHLQFVMSARQISATHCLGHGRALIGPGPTTRLGPVGKDVTAWLPGGSL